jgi:hypothetical protein
MKEISINSELIIKSVTTCLMGASAQMERLTVKHQQMEHSLQLSRGYLSHGWEVMSTKIISFHTPEDFQGSQRFQLEVFTTMLKM